MKSIVEKLNKPVFFISVAIYTLLFGFILLFKGPASTAINGAMNFTLHNLGWIYILGYAFVIISCGYLAFSKFGKKRFGGDDARPEYSFFAWVGMLFCAGLGVGLVFFGVSEPVSHYLSCPTAESGTFEALGEAMPITLFHWSVSPWAIYSIVGLAVGYFAYEKGLPPVISTALYPLLGKKNINGIPGKLVDAFSLIALVCGISMSLGFAAVQSITGIGEELGLSTSFRMVVIATSIIGICAMCAALSGIQKGIKYLSEFNTYLVFALILFVLLTGPTLNIINIMLETLGVYLAQFPKMIFHVDGFGIVENNLGFNWSESWTIFYWAWWVAFAPFVGTFLAKISKGRTIREFIVACILMPSLLCMIWFCTFGGTTIWMDLTSQPGLAELANQSAEGSLFVLLKALPFAKLSIALSIILILTLIITSMDSAVFMATVFSCKTNVQQPYSLRIFWAVYVIINALLMIWLGGLELLKYTAVVLAFPFMLLVILMTWGLLKEAMKSKS